MYLEDNVQQNALMLDMYLILLDRRFMAELVCILVYEYMYFNKNSSVMANPRVGVFG